jgi:hypothetical protein
MATTAGFSASAHDLTLFVHVSPRGRTLLLLYVDDMVITSDDPEYITFVKAHLSDQFLMFDLGPLMYFVGIEISSTPEGFFLSQEKYIYALLDRASLTDHRTAKTLMDLNVHLTTTNGEPVENPTRYHHIVKSLVYLGVTRLYISYSATRSTIVTFFISCVIFVGLSLVTCSLHALALYSSRHIVILPGLVISLTVVPFFPSVSFLVVPSLLERLRSRYRFLVRVQRLSCVL